MRTRLPPFILLLSLGWAPQVVGGMPQSFYMERVAWHATHIVVATEGEKIDGVCSVIESWKGDLKAGDTITIPGLAEFAKEDVRAVSPRCPSAMNDLEETGPPEHRGPRHVTGSRMVLFLREVSLDIAAGKGETLVAVPRDRPSWADADLFGGMKTSVAWIEKGNAYAFVATDPGPSRLVSWNMSEKEMKTRAGAVVRTQTAFRKATALPDPAGRAEALRAFAGSDLYFARRAALNEMVNCERSALPVLRSMLRDGSLAGRHGEIVWALARAGAANSGPELTALAEEELLFWRKRRWWDGVGLSRDEAQRLQARYDRTMWVLISLEQFPYPACRKTVTRFRDFWRSTPQLIEDRRRQMVNLCDAVLKALEKPASASHK